MDIDTGGSAYVAERREVIPMPGPLWKRRLTVRAVCTSGVVESLLNVVPVPGDETGPFLLVLVCAKPDEPQDADDETKQADRTQHHPPHLRSMVSPAPGPASPRASTTNSSTSTVPATSAAAEPSATMASPAR